jgi:hypothetical protein
VTSKPAICHLMDSDFEVDEPTVAKSAPLKSQCLRSLETAWMINTRPAAVALASDEKHANKCQRTHCVRCQYVSRGPELAKLTPMIHESLNLARGAFKADKLQAAKGCWLSSAKVDGKWGLGCIPCCARGVPGVFATFSWRGAGTICSIAIAKLLKHHNSLEHKRAVATYFGIEEDALGAPPVDAMVQHLCTLMEGKTGDSGRKSLAMTWCLREALLDIDREFMQNAKTLTLCRDDRNQRLLMRFYGATARLDVRSGVLGIGTAHRDNPDADGLVAATKQVLDEFCTKRRGAPTHGDGPHDVVAELDVELLRHLSAIIEVIAVDEAGDELKAVEIGRGRRNSALDLAPITPNLKFVSRDRAHGFRRTDIDLK